MALAVCIRSGLINPRNWRGLLLGALALYLAVVFALALAVGFAHELTGSPLFLPVALLIVAAVGLVVARRVRQRMRRREDPFSPFPTR